MIVRKKLKSQSLRVTEFFSEVWKNLRSYKDNCLLEYYIELIEHCPHNNVSLISYFIPKYFKTNKYFYKSFTVP